MTQPLSPLLRIGIFGGAFDPPHVAHVALAQTALEQLQLDALHVVPTGDAWHKTRRLTLATHRLEMARLAFADIPDVVVDSREVDRVGPSYSVDTLTELHAVYPLAQLFLVIGQDQAHALPTWQRWRDILQLATICVAVRSDLSGAGGSFNELLLAQPECQLLKMPVMDISATDIRLRLANHQSVAPLVTKAVARYIAHHHLYQTA